MTLPESIDTGIGNTFWAQKYSILFSNTFAKIHTLEQLKRSVEIEHRNKETAARLSNSICTWITPGSDSGYCSHSSSKGISSPAYRKETLPLLHAEVESYLSDPSTKLSSLKAYPNIHQVYLSWIPGYQTVPLALTGSPVYNFKCFHQKSIAESIGECIS